MATLSVSAPRLGLSLTVGVSLSSPENYQATMLQWLFVKHSYFFETEEVLLGRLFMAEKKIRSLEEFA